MRVQWQIKIDEDIRREFKIRCVQLNLTMQEALEYAMQEWSNKNEDIIQNE